MQPESRQDVKKLLPRLPSSRPREMHRPEALARRGVFRVEPAPPTPLRCRVCRPKPGSGPDSSPPRLARRPGPKGAAYRGPFLRKPPSEARRPRLRVAPGKSPRGCEIRVARRGARPKRPSRAVQRASEEALPGRAAGARNRRRPARRGHARESAAGRRAEIRAPRTGPTKRNRSSAWQIPSRSGATPLGSRPAEAARAARALADTSVLARWQQRV